jgi:hypothetical protein
MPCFTIPKQFYDTCLAHHKIVTSRSRNLSSCLCNLLTRLNNFNLRLRPIGLRPSCLTFGITSACPMFTIWWLTYLTRVGFPPTGIIDLARPHSTLSLNQLLDTFYIPASLFFRYRKFNLTFQMIIKNSRNFINGKRGCIRHLNISCPKNWISCLKELYL